MSQMQIKCRAVFYVLEARIRNAVSAELGSEHTACSCSCGLQGCRAVLACRRMPHGTRAGQGTAQFVGTGTTPVLHVICVRSWTTRCKSCPAGARHRQVAGRSPSGPSPGIALRSLRCSEGSALTPTRPQLRPWFYPWQDVPSLLSVALTVQFPLVFPSSLAIPQPHRAVGCSSTSQRPSAAASPALPVPPAILAQ